ncbi:MAG: hypothetical protein DCF30_05730 [Hyphomicrobiales bacterium]|nr:MAG: hypothetical protein DCF30_05730 [Hyphomicrobiales bacterium]
MTSVNRSTIALAGLLLALCDTTAQAAPSSKIFRDWLVGCDNLKACTAMSLPEETAEHVSFLKLTRPAGPQGALTAVNRIRGEKLKPAFELMMAIDGAAFPSPGKRWAATSVDGENAEVALSAGEAEALIAAARKASKATVMIGDRTFDISLSGAVAALLWMDEQQGRLNTTSALIRKGPGTHVPPAPPLPLVTARGTAAPAIPTKTAEALTAALREHLKRTEPDACADKPDDFKDTKNVWPLGGTLRLVGLLCYAGAYNFGTGYWIVSGSDVAKARRAMFPRLDGKPEDTLVNADVSTETGTISYFSKGRGVGDCGSAGTYAWTGSAFVLASLTEMSICRGITLDDWLTLVRSDLKTAN